MMIIRWVLTGIIVCLSSQALAFAGFSAVVTVALHDSTTADTTQQSVLSPNSDTLATDTTPHEIKHTFWVSGGAAPYMKDDRGRGGLVLSMIGSYNYAADNQLFSLRLWGHTVEPVNVGEVGALYGRIERDLSGIKNSLASYSFGLGYVFGDYYPSSIAKERQSVRTVGLALDAQVGIEFLFFGLGVGAHANLNFIKSFGAVTILLLLVFP